MSDEKEMPSVDEIKDRLKVEISVEEEEPAASSSGSASVVDELSKLGKNFAESVRGARSREDIQRFESELREGFQSFVGEVENVVREVREGTTGQKIKEEVSGLRETVKSDDVGANVKGGVVKGLRWLSEEMGKLADQFGGNQSNIEDEIKIGDEINQSKSAE